MFIEPVTLAATATEELNWLFVPLYVKLADVPATSNPAPSAVAFDVEPLAKVINLSSTTKLLVFN